MKQILPFETVIFDLDGTLAQSAPGVFQCVTEALQRMNKPIPDEATLRKFIGPPLCHSFIHFCGMTQEEADIGVAHYRDVYLNGGIYNNSTFPYIMELLQNLKEHGAKLCVATSKPEPMAKIVLDHLKVTPFLDYMAGADLDERHSNKTELIEKGLLHCNTKPNHAVMIGDTHFDAHGAKHANTNFIGVLYGYGTRKEMEQEGATQFVEIAKELQSILLPNFSYKF